MASVLVSAAVKSQSLVLMEHFSDQEQLQDAINCSEECNALLESPPIPPLSEYSTDHPRRKLDDYTRQQADLWLGVGADHVTGLLEETKQAVSVVKETRQRVRSRKEHNMEKTREVFNALRKVVNEREEQVITDIMKVADERENALKVLCDICRRARNIERVRNIFSYSFTKEQVDDVKPSNFKLNPVYKQIYADFDCSS